MTETPDDILHMPEYEVRACKTTFRLQLPEMMDGFRLTLRRNRPGIPSGLTPPS